MKSFLLSADKHNIKKSARARSDDFDYFCNSEVKEAIVSYHYPLDLLPLPPGYLTPTPLISYPYPLDLLPLPPGSLTPTPLMRHSYTLAVLAASPECLRPTRLTCHPLPLNVHAPTPECPSPICYKPLNISLPSGIMQEFWTKRMRPTCASCRAGCRG